ncbi:MAG: glycosyltransferase family 39 protein [Candidatus Caenarcaniphilales bacterium]|nr:glycosyltransferase family 39 protein [Candidatus Caenarcaniphilales bacterium]
MSLGIYLTFDFLTHTVFVNYTPTDLAEQILWTQNLKIGYGIQPPLYSYLQIVLVKLFGINLFTFQILHEMLFTGTVAFIYLIFRELESPLPQPPHLDRQGGSFALLPLSRGLGGDTITTLAAFSFAFVTGEFIEVPVKTHTAIATFMSTATFFLFIKILKGPSTKLFLWLGLVLGMGLLSKYNFAFLVICLLIAAATNQESRKKIFQPNLLISFLITSLIITPNLLWLLENRHLAVKNFAPKVLQYKPPELSLLSELLQTFNALFSDLFLVYFVPFTVCFLCIYLLSRFQKAKDQTPENHIPEKEFFQNPGTSLFVRFFIITLSIILLLAFGFKINRVRTFWFQPLFFYLPGLTLLFLYIKGHWNKFAEKILTVVLCGLICVSPFFKIYYIKNHVETKQLTRQDMQETYIKAIKNTGFKQGLIIADLDRNPAADIKLFFPESKVIWWEDRFNREFEKSEAQSVLVVSNGMNEKELADVFDLGKFERVDGGFESFSEKVKQKNPEVKAINLLIQTH